MKNLVSHNINLLLTVLAVIVASGLMTGCTAGKKAAKSISVSPESCILSPDNTGRIEMDLVINVPENYFSVRSRLIITPQLMSGDSVIEIYRPIVLDAPIYSKKKKRVEVLEEYCDPYAGEAVAVDDVSYSYKIPYRQSVNLPDSMDNAVISGIVRTDGCGKCGTIDTVGIARVSNPVTLIDVRKSLDICWMNPEFVIRPKVMNGKGVANLQFIINKYDINLSLGNNETELTNMVNKLSPILNDSLATLNSLEINGMASADGSLPFNTALARNRAESAKRWLTGTLGLSAGIQKIIKVGSRPEGWLPVFEAMKADDNPDSAAVWQILEKYRDFNDDVQERHIRSLPCWRQIREKYLQKDRKVEYVYSYTIRSFTDDEELLDMYGKRPDAFNEDELLRVAALAGTHDEKKEVYLVIMKYFPQSQVAANNLAVLYLNEGNENEAVAVLNSLDELSAENLNSLAASYIYANEYEKAIELLQGLELPSARYNLGLVKARQRKLQEAYDLLRPFADVNSAICALSLDKNDDAEEIMESCNDTRPVAEYVRSMIAARKDDAVMFSEHIGSACADPVLRCRAASEPDFGKYMDEESFVKALNR